MTGSLPVHKIQSSDGPPPIHLQIVPKEQTPYYFHGGIHERLVSFIVSFFVCLYVNMFTMLHRSNKYRVRSEFLHVNYLLEKTFL
jgi:hypothetical protein